MKFGLARNRVFEQCQAIGHDDGYPGASFPRRREAIRARWMPALAGMTSLGARRRHGSPTLSCMQERERVFVAAKTTVLPECRA